MKKILAYRILNYKQANSSIELLLAGSDRETVHFNPNQMESFVAACTMLLNSNVVFYDKHRAVFAVQTSRNRQDSDEINDFLDGELV